MLGSKYQPFGVFSIYSNGKKLFACGTSEVSSGTIQCIDGIRALSTVWIVYVHAFEVFLTNQQTEYQEVIDGMLQNLKITIYDIQIHEFVRQQTPNAWLR